MTDQSQPEQRRWRAPAVVLVVVLAIVLVVTGGVSLITNGLPRPSVTPSPPPTAGADGFPTEVLGMRVVTVAEAVALIDSRTLEGRAVAVKGWWQVQMPMSCPMPMGFVPPLFGFCDYQTFASAAYSTWACDPSGNSCGTAPRPPGVSQMVLRQMKESVATDAAQVAAAASPGKVGAPAVLIGHAGDPRLWHCAEPDRVDCARQFVVDRVAWLNGSAIDQVSAVSDVAHGMVDVEAIAAARKDGAPISAIAVRLGDAMEIDPRFHGAGGAAVWVVRTVRAGEEVAGDDATRGVDVTLVADDTGAILSEVGLEMTADYQPAVLLIQATEPTAQADDQVVPFYRVELPDGTGVQEMRIGGDSWSSGAVGQRYEAGLPVVLEPGDYVVHAWRAQAAHDPSLGATQGDCSTTVSAGALAQVRLEVAFPATGACTFVPPTFESVFD